MENFIKETYAKLENIKEKRMDAQQRSKSFGVAPSTFSTCTNTNAELEEIRANIKNEEEKNMLEILLKSFNLKG